MKTFKFGGIDITILEQQNNQIPTTAQEIELPADDRKALAIAIEKDLPTLLIGETGTGKTSIIKYLAFKRKQGYTRINMNGYSTPDELIGSKSVKNGATYYEDGQLTKAMREGHIVVLDEINATPPDCLFILHGLLDDDKRVTLPNGEVITPHPDFRFFATMNPDYEGTKSLNRAFADRFNIVLIIDVLNPKKEEALLVKREKIDVDNASKMVVTGVQARKCYIEQKTLTFVSTRSLLQWAKLIGQGLSVKQAYIQAILNKTQERERPAFMDIYNSVFKVAPDDTGADNNQPIVTTKGELKRLEKLIEDNRLDAQEQYNKRQELETKLNNLRDIEQKALEVEKLTKEAQEIRTKYEELKAVIDNIKKATG